MINISGIDQYIDENLEDSIEELSRYCVQPSVAAQNFGMEETALMTVEMLEARGFEVKLIPAEGPPFVFGERKGIVDKTIIFYNHYDVQPAEPLDLWDSAPFEPTIRDGRLFARGVGDDKGHITSRLFAIDALLAKAGELPCNVKFIIEGEEEVGSPHIDKFIHENLDLLKADVCIWEFGGVNFQGRFLQPLGMRGMCYVELSVETVKMDAHSGLGGSLFPNAIWRLVWALSCIKGSDGKILIPGFYDPIVPPDEKEKSYLAQLPDMSEHLKERYGLSEFVDGDAVGIDFYLKANYEPTCTVNGITGGYQGLGAKTVLPAKASAKLDFRLVPNQMPQDVYKALKAHLADNGFGDVQVKMLGGDPPAKTDPEDEFVTLVNKAAEEVYGQPPLITPLIGGSGPSYPFIHHLGLPVVSAGIGDAFGNAHAPNESIDIELYVKGAKHIARILMAFGNS